VVRVITAGSFEGRKMSWEDGMTSQLWICDRGIDILIRREMKFPSAEMSVPDSPANFMLCRATFPLV
jgi:hypothetical protein